MRRLAGPPAEWQPPAQGYAIYSLPRSGSNLLCEQLRAADTAGRPAEWLHDRYEARDADGAAAMRRVREAGTTANGVFAIKLFPPHLTRLERRGIDFAQWFPGLAPVLLTRRDLLGQAISLALATQTGRWVSGNETQHPPSYDAAEIARMLNHLVEWEAYWRRRFALRQTTPLELVYEDFADAPASGANRVLAFAGLPPLTGDASLSLQPQGDAVNREWRERFQVELAQRGYTLEDRPRRARAGLASLGAWLTGRLRRPPFTLD